MGLSPEDAARFARAHGLVTGDHTTAAPLGGGVSNDTLLVSDGARSVVVKRALGRLRTAVEWRASPTRALEEARALRLAGRLTPGRVPPVLAADADTATIALAAAPAAWRDWKVELLAGTVRPGIGATLGAVLGAWHGRTHDAPGLLDGLDGIDRMEALRLEPFHAVIARRHCDLAGRIHGAAAELRAERICLVHGDFSPKNVLVGDGGLWVIDFEVAHVGNPVFDLAFLCTHLLLKALAGRHAASLRATADAFLEAYRRALVDSALDAERVLARLALHTGCLVLARLDGTSVVDYLDGSATDRARRLGRQLIGGQARVVDVWDEVEAADG